MLIMSRQKYPDFLNLNSDMAFIKIDHDKSMIAMIANITPNPVAAPA